MKKLIIMIALLGVAMFTLDDAFAGANPLRSIGINAGYVSPEDADATWLAGMSLDFGLPATNFLVQPFVNYWNLSQTVGGVDSDFTDWTVGGNVKFQIPTAMVSLSPYVGAGVSAHLTNASVQSLNLDSSETKFGWQAGAGLKFDTGSRWGLHAEGWYNGVENFNHYSLVGGVHINL